MLSIALVLFLVRRSSQWCADWTCAIVIVATVITLMISSGSSFHASAEDQFGNRNRHQHTRGLQGQRKTGILADASAALPKQHRHLREGTPVPATSGRFVMMGRRWAFVPASVDAEWDENAPPATGPSSTDVRFHSPRSRSEGLPPPLGVPSIGLETVSPGPELPQLLVVENLMLQRIVEAIRADTADDRWTVTGSLVEFFDENRLVIQTAQRASSQ